MAVSNTGKQAEAAVQTALKSVSLPCFDWQRMYDATSARGAFMAQVGDFEVFLPDRHGVIEVKSTQHGYRLAKSAFSDGQRAKLARRMAAGGRIGVLVLHHTTGVWRFVPYNLCHETFATGHASLDLRHLPEDADAAASLTRYIAFMLEDYEYEQTNHNQ